MDTRQNRNIEADGPFHGVSGFRGNRARFLVLRGFGRFPVVLYRYIRLPACLTSLPRLRIFMLRRWNSRLTGARAITRRHMYDLVALLIGMHCDAIPFAIFMRRLFPDGRMLRIVRWSVLIAITGSTT